MIFLLSHCPFFIWNWKIFSISLFCLFFRAEVLNVLFTTVVFPCSRSFACLFPCASKPCIVLTITGVHPNIVHANMSISTSLISFGIIHISFNITKCPIFHKSNRGLDAICWIRFEFNWSEPPISRYVCSLLWFAFLCYRYGTEYGEEKRFEHFFKL